MFISHKTIGHVMDAKEHPSIILQESEGPVQFVLTSKSITPDKPSSVLIRVYYKLNGDVQTFQSLIITPTMTTKEVLDMAVSKAGVSGSADDYSLVLLTPKGGIPFK